MVELAWPGLRMPSVVEAAGGRLKILRDEANPRRPFIVSESNRMIQHDLDV